MGSLVASCVAVDTFSASETGLRCFVASLANFALQPALQIRNGLPACCKECCYSVVTVMPQTGSFRDCMGIA